MTKVQEKKHRLEKEFYRGEKIVSFTICTKGREKIFTSENIFLIIRDMLLEAIEKGDCDALIYLFMPDHLHLILQGINKNSDVIKSVDLFKQKSGFWFGQNMNYSRWQKDYHDHVIRSNEDLKSHIYYILNNPVRAGLVENWKKYNFKGSTVYDFEEWE